MSRKIELEDLLTFACKFESKKPATWHGHKDAKVQNIEDLTIKGYNVGLAMKLNNLICLDVDEKNGKTGLQDLQKLEEQLGKLPKTLKQKTCSGNGYHLIFSDEGIESPPAHIGESKGIDIRWDGYILREPSYVKGHFYRFVSGIDRFGTATIAKLPDTWIEFINTGGNKRKSVTKNNAITCNYVKNEYKPIENLNLEKIFNGCKFLQYCRDNAINLSELCWFSMISVLAQLKGCEFLIHELSAPYPNYSFKETEYKINRAKDFGKAQSCRYISSQFPEICEDCPKAKRSENGK